MLFMVTFTPRSTVCRARTIRHKCIKHGGDASVCFIESFYCQLAILWRSRDRCAAIPKPGSKAATDGSVHHFSLPGSNGGNQAWQQVNTRSPLIFYCQDPMSMRIACRKAEIAISGNFQKEGLCLTATLIRTQNSCGWMLQCGV
jgi:hypothetical protein